MLGSLELELRVAESPDVLCKSSKCPSPPRHLFSMGLVILSLWLLSRLTGWSSHTPLPEVPSAISTYWGTPCRIHTLKHPAISTHWYTEYGVWVHSRFECRGCFQYIQSQKTIGWLQKAGQEKNAWVFHKFWTRIGVFNCPGAHCRSQPKWWEDWLAYRGPRSVSHMGRHLQRCYDTTLRGNASQGWQRYANIGFLWTCQDRATFLYFQKHQVQMMGTSLTKPLAFCLAEMLRWGKKIAAAADGREDKDWLPK